MKEGFHFMTWEKETIRDRSGRSEEPKGFLKMKNITIEIGSSMLKNRFNPNKERINKLKVLKNLC